MKTSKTIPILTAVAVSIVAIQLFTAHSACAAGSKQAEKTGASIAEFRDEILNIKKETDATLAALDKVVADATTDPRKAFNEFNKAVPRIDAAAQKARKRSESMKAQGQTYFKEWEQELAQLKSEDIRKLAEERKAKLQATFSEIKTSMEPAKEQFNAWLADLKDLQTYLTMNLNLQGIDAGKELIAKSKSEGQEVQKTLDKVVAELNTIVATLTPKVEQAPEK